MNRTLKIYIGFLVLLFVAIVFIEFSTPSPINWTPTYNETQKIPFGTYIFYEELGELFPDSKIKDITVTPYEYFDDRYSWEDSTYQTSGTYMLIDAQPKIDRASAQELLDFASYGNDIFISSNYFPDRLKDTLGFNTNNKYSFSGKAKLTYTNPSFKHDSIIIKKGSAIFIFQK